jgi:hypothetical protein
MAFALQPCVLWYDLLDDAKGLTPMTETADQLTQACRRMVEDYVQTAFEAARGLPSHISEIPFIGGEYFPHGSEETHADLKRKVRAALYARERHNLAAPRWAQPLPLREHECIELKRDADNKLKLVGYFAMSWRKCTWDARHPLFARFCCALFAVDPRLSAPGPSAEGDVPAPLAAVYRRPFALAFALSRGTLDIGPLPQTCGIFSAAPSDQASKGLVPAGAGGLLHERPAGGLAPRNIARLSALAWHAP